MEPSSKTKSRASKRRSCSRTSSPPSRKSNKKSADSTDLPSAFVKVKSVPNNPCQLCLESHHPFLCTKFSTLEARKKRACELKLCQVCLIPHGSDCKHLSVTLCKWITCMEKGDHHTTFCPNQRYPIADKTVKEWKDKLARTKAPQREGENSDKALVGEKTISSKTNDSSSSSQLANSLNILTLPSNQTPESTNEQPIAQPTLSESTILIFSVKRSTPSHLSTFKTIIQVWDSDPKYQVNAFFDSGAPKTFLVHSVAKHAKQLNLQGEKSLMTLEGVEGQKSEPFVSEKVKFTIFSPNSQSSTLHTQTINKIGWNLSQLDTRLFYQHILSIRTKNSPFFRKKNTLYIS